MSHLPLPSLLLPIQLISSLNKRSLLAPSYHSLLPHDHLVLKQSPLSLVSILLQCLFIWTGLTWKLILLTSFDEEERKLSPILKRVSLHCVLDTFLTEVTTGNWRRKAPMIAYLKMTPLLNTSQFTSFLTLVSCELVAAICSPRFHWMLSAEQINVLYHPTDQCTLPSCSDSNQIENLGLPCRGAWLPPTGTTA